MTKVYCDICEKEVDSYHVYQTLNREYEICKSCNKEIVDYVEKLKEAKKCQS